MASPAMDNVGARDGTSDERVEIDKVNDIDSPLLRLPPELRNRVYEYALYNDSGCVFLHPCSDKIKGKNYVISSAVYKEFQEANPLQRVCIRTRKETRRMEMRINKQVKMQGVIFPKLVRDMDWRLKNFTGRMEIQRTSGIAINADTVMLHDSIMKYARNNPEANINVIVASWSFSGRQDNVRDFLCLGWTMEKYLKGKKGLSFPGSRNAGKTWNGSGEKMDLLNLKFCPAAGIFPEEVFRHRAATSEKYFVLQFAIKIYKDKEKLVEAVRGWYADGI